MEGIGISRLEKKLEDGTIQLNQISHELKLQIQQARLDKKLTQKEFAQKCNLPLQTIQAYERGEGMLKGNHLVIIRKVLGVKLKK